MLFFSLVPEKAELAPNSIEKFGLHKTFLLKEYHEPRTLYKFTLEPKNYTDIFGDTGRENILQIHFLRNVIHKFVLSCSTGLSEVSMVIVVKSENGNIERRQAIRATWGTYENQSDFKMFTVFIVGLTENKELQLNISEESKKYGDILQIDAEDDYEWVSTCFCICNISLITERSFNINFYLSEHFHCFSNFKYLHFSGSQTTDETCYSTILSFRESAVHW